MPRTHTIDFAWTRMEQIKTDHRSPRRYSPEIWPERVRSTSRHDEFEAPHFRQRGKLGRTIPNAPFARWNSNADLRRMIMQSIGLAGQAQFPYMHTPA